MSVVYGVHVIRSENVAPIDVVFTGLDAAQWYAQTLSADTGVLAGAVTRFVLNELGQRTPTALFVTGTRQQVPHLSDDRDLWANAVMPRYSHEPSGSP